MLGKTEGNGERVVKEEIVINSITNSMDMNLSELQEIMVVEKPSVLKSMGSQRVRYDTVTKQ